MYWLIFQHLAVTAVLVGWVAFVCRLFRPSAAVQHGLWTVVLLKLMIPPVVTWPWAVSDVAQAVGMTVTMQADWPTVTAADRARALASEASSGAASSLAIAADVDALPAPQQASPGAADPSTSTAAGSSGMVAREAWAAFGAGWTVTVQWLLLGTWVVGMAVLAAWDLFSIRQARKLLIPYREPPDWLHDALLKRSMQMGVSTPRLVISDRVKSPFIWCSPNPKLVWPASLAGSSSTVADCMLVHELAHVRRHDHWVVWLDLLVKLTWWWNPLTWYVRRRLHDNAELACDSWVIRLLPDQRHDYASSLVTLCGNTAGHAFPLPAVGAHTGTRRAFERRLVMIMCERTSACRSRWLSLYAGLLLLVAIPGFAWATRDEESSSAVQSPTMLNAPIADGGDAAAVTEIGADNDATAAASEDQSGSDAQPSDRQQRGSSAKVDAALLNEVIEKLAGGMADGVDQRVLIEAAIQAMLEKVDENAVYLSADDLDTLVRQIDGTVGVGIALHLDDGRLTITRTLPSSPAARSGLRAGDVIVQIDGKQVASLADAEQRLVVAVRLIRGKVGEPVTLGIRRSESDEVKQIQIVRETVKIDAVRGYRRTENGWQFVLDDDARIGYARITSFNKSTAQDVKAVVEQLEAAGVAGMIVDLRDCPGGQLMESIKVADLFVEEGLIVRTEGTVGEAESHDYRAQSQGTHHKMVLVVLVNPRTASAAEILVACLQDHDRAVVVGQRTYGRGIVQSIVQLKAGGGALRLTAAKIVRPNGKYIQRWADAKEADDWGCARVLIARWFLPNSNSDRSGNNSNSSNRRRAVGRTLSLHAIRSWSAP